MTDFLIATLATIVGGVATYYVLRWVRQRPEKAWIRYRDRIRLIHVPTGQALHSHNLALCHAGSSGQQQVTCYGGADSNDYWVVKSAHGYDEFAAKGAKVDNGSIVRLEHYNTRKNLHSHATVVSPVSGQQEVTAFGTDGIGDTNDNWRVDVHDGGAWLAERAIRLIHVNTAVVLHSHRGYQHPTYTAGQQEVTGFSDRDPNDLWTAVRVRNDAR